MNQRIEVPPATAADDESYDAVIAAPQSHRVVFEDDTRRELVVIVEPGVREPFHHHRWHSEMRIYRSAAMRYYDASGTYRDSPKDDVAIDAPLIEQRAPEPLHSVENLSEHDVLFALRIEFKHQ
jgi:hypothetical protein